MKTLHPSLEHLLTMLNVGLIHSVEQVEALLNRTLARTDLTAEERAHLSSLLASLPHLEAERGERPVNAYYGSVLKQPSP